MDENPGSRIFYFMRKTDPMSKWMAIYNDFVAGYESGLTMIEIARRNNVSERTIYRYKAYYDELKDKNEMESK